jgi:ABC-type transporter Mla MlaB component
MAAPPRGTIAFTVEGPISRDDLPGLYARLCSLLTESRPQVALCEVGGVEPDAVTVEALSRLQLAARHFGCKVFLCNASPELLELVAFMGLADVLPVEPRG